MIKQQGQGGPKIHDKKMPDPPQPHCFTRLYEDNNPPVKASRSEHKEDKEQGKVEDKQTGAPGIKDRQTDKQNKDERQWRL